MSRQALPPSVWSFEPHRWPPDDCVASGADLAPGTIVEAYRHGAFPMPYDGEVLWWSPLLRGVLHPADFHASRSLHRSLRRFAVTVDESFEEVIDACADPARPGAWINGAVRAAYVRLHELGWAHSVETRNVAGDLVGGLYGLSIGGLFAGESMFHRETDASKAAVMALAEIIGPGGLIDVQWSTPHLASLGVVEWPRDHYVRTLDTLVDASPPPQWA